MLVTEDVENLRLSGLPWFDSERVRGTFWYRIVRTWKPIFVFCLMGPLFALALSCLGGALATIYTILNETLSGSDLIFLSVIFLADVVLGPMLVVSSVRMVIAFRDLSAKRTSVSATSASNASELAD